MSDEDLENEATDNLKHPVYHGTNADPYDLWIDGLQSGYNNGNYNKNTLI